MNLNKKATVHIADDHPAIIDGFNALLSNYGMNVVGFSLTGKQTLEWFRNSSADILILDISMPELNGIEVLRHFSKQNSSPEIIVVSSYLDTYLVEESLKLGASAYISKSEASSSILKAIESVLVKKEIYVSPQVKEKKIELKNEEELDEKLVSEGLSERELQVFKMVAKNYSSDEISEGMSISKSTFRSYVSRIKEKLNIKNIVGIIRYTHTHKHY